MPESFPVPPRLPCKVLISFHAQDPDDQNSHLTVKLTTDITIPIQPLVELPLDWVFEGLPNGRFTCEVNRFSWVVTDGGYFGVDASAVGFDVEDERSVWEVGEMVERLLPLGFAVESSEVPQIAAT